MAGLKTVFSGVERLSIVGLVALAAVSPLMCVYYFGAAHSLRSGRSLRLPAVSIPAVAGFVVVLATVDMFRDSVDLAMVAYMAVVLVMSVGAFAAAAGRELVAWLPRAGRLGLGLVPIIGIYVCALAIQ
jgi:hypothetical protein